MGVLFAFIPTPILLVGVEQTFALHFMDGHRVRFFRMVVLLMTRRLTAGPPWPPFLGKGLL